MSCPSDRLEITCNHIVAENEKVSNNNNNNNIEVNHVYGDENGIDIETLRNIIDGKEWKFKDKCREFLANNPSFVIQDDPTRSSVYQRERLFSLLRQIGISGLAKSEDAVYRPNRFFALLEVISYFDLGLFLKTFIQYLVWGGSVVRIGTERHSHLLKDINSVDLCGAYGMTEQGHGSNVRACQTTAIYDKENKEFIINSPNDGSRKMWIANTACHGLKACIFARLILDGRDCGVNAFIVPIRNKSLIIEKNVEIEDCGNKLGMNGLDNGILRFTNKRIPRENLLNKVTDVTEDGSLISIFDRETDRFRAITESLVGERLSPFLGPTKVGLIISLRYANWRVQFSPGKGQQEVPLLFYTSHKRRLLQILGTLFGYDFMYHYLWDRVESSPTQADIEEIYALSAGVKSYSGWFTNLALQTFTECCGAQGFRACNRFGHFKADAGAMLTGAGDNTVLVQQVAKFMFNNYYRQSKNIKNKKQDKFTGVLEHLNKNPVCIFFLFFHFVNIFLMYHYFIVNLSFSNFHNIIL
eukprot:TRINITY_DN2360_c0_g1_i2.p1 TRINITY_DN2360_c0_g1~~TRINITY_DN2360_c0_g1_i2.p1  ORF type:complete len:527 (-),score=184.79 TRINITY_DN2360_c0_g1_i2:551-2131(-)